MNLLTDKEIEYCECFYTPRCLIESLFHDFDNLSAFDSQKLGNIRLYQVPMISHEAIIDFDTTAKYHKLNLKQLFQLKKNVGDIYCFGARKFGKSLMVEKLDLIITFLCKVAKKVAFASVDLIHIKEILDSVKEVFDNHPVAKLWTRRTTRSPEYKFEFKNDLICNSVNFNIGSKSPGQQWYGKRVDRIYIEEASLESEEVCEKRKEAISELGAVYRISGMTDFTAHSPAGKAFYNPDNKRAILNYPQFVNPYWDEKEKKDRIAFYGGEESLAYKVFVKGEVVEDGSSTFDMARVRSQCYLADKKGKSIETIKRYEITKDSFPYFKNLLVVDRPNNAERIFINADIGEKVTEIIIHSEIGNAYKYLYNIPLYNLTHLEQWDIFRFICEKLEFNVLGLDCGDGMGRAIYREAEKVFPKDNLVWYEGNRKIPVDFAMNDNNQVIMENGKPTYREEHMSEWSVKRLQDLLYNGRCIIPDDFKFDSQFSSVISMMSGSRLIYKCVSQMKDHFFDAWKVFSIAQWLKKDFNKTKAVKHTTWGVGACSWTRGDK